MSTVAVSAGAAVSTAAVSAGAAVSTASVVSAVAGVDASAEAEESSLPQAEAYCQACDSCYNCCKNLFHFL